jgi:hypothetical protein
MAFDSTDAPKTLTVLDPRKLKTPRERLEYLRDFLRELPDEKLNMSSYFHDQVGSRGWVPRKALKHSCGTAACVAGWSISLFRSREPQQTNWESARQVLGLSNGDAGRLFTPPGWSGEEAFSPQKAADAIQAYLDTGEVPYNWGDH